MESTELFLWLIEYKYVLMFPLAIIEGPIVTIICGFLLQLGHVEFWPTYLALMAGDLCGDSIWYVIGRFFARPFMNRYGHKVGFTPARIGAVEGLFKKHHSKTLFISKLTTGFGLAPLVLMTAAASKIPFKTYFALNFLGQIIWTALLLVIGIFFGQFYVTIDKQFRIGYMISMGLALVTGFYLLQRYLRRSINKGSL